MTETDVLLKMVGIADMTGDLEPKDAMSVLASMIYRLDMGSENYRRDMEGLLRVGATLWKMLQSEDVRLAASMNLLDAPDDGHPCNGPM